MIKPPRLIAFANLNLAIEASLSGTSLFEIFNTNALIKQILTAIPVKNRTRAIKSIGVLIIVSLLPSNYELPKYRKCQTIKYCC